MGGSAVFIHQAIDLDTVATVARNAQDSGVRSDLAEGDDAAGQCCRGEGEMGQFGSPRITPAHAERGVFRGVWKVALNIYAKLQKLSCKQWRPRGTHIASRDDNADPVDGTPPSERLA